MSLITGRKSVGRSAHCIVLGVDFGERVGEGL